MYRSGQDIGFAGVPRSQISRGISLEKALEPYRIAIAVRSARVGPVVTLFEVETGRGVTSASVVARADDIARAMGVTAVRIAPVQGRPLLGIEIPNAKREDVLLDEIWCSPEFLHSPAKLPLALGKTIDDQPFVADLALMPHLLVAGTTGSGKSVGLHTMILSILTWKRNSGVKFIMIDPKMGIELEVYNGIPQLLTPVISDPKQAVDALKWAAEEMAGRYLRMKQAGTKNIDGYNRNSPPEPMPYVVIVVDEMADLMQTAGKAIESAIQRLAQMARAAGIHLIMATQRPSVDVVTGIIKANFPARISYQVTSVTDSRTILDQAGAEQLLGAGDMLYRSPGGLITRVHGANVSEAGVQRAADELRGMGVPQYLEEIVGGVDGNSQGGSQPPCSLQDGGFGTSREDKFTPSEWMQIALKSGPRPQSKMLEEGTSANGLGFSQSAIYRHMTRIGVIGYDDEHGVRMWRLPTVDSHSQPDFLATNQPKRPG